MWKVPYCKGTLHLRCYPHSMEKFYSSSCPPIRVNWPVIVHLKTQRNFVIWADLGCLWGPKMSYRGALGTPSAL